MGYCIFLRRAQRSPALVGGFALTELLIAIGIMTLVLSVVLVRQSGFNSAVLLENQAYEVAFDIRQTQLQAVSAQGGLDGDFYQSYQIDFTSDDRRYSISRVAEGSPPQQIGGIQQLDPRFEVIAIRAPDGDLSLTSTPKGLPSVSIRFTRPNFDAVIRDLSGSELDAVQIYLCPLADTSSLAAELSARVAQMAAGNIPQNLRYDLNNSGSVTPQDALTISRLDCMYRMVEVTSTGQITVR